LKKKEHIGFEGLAHNAANFYEHKGYSHKEALEIGKRVAGAQNAKYVHNYRGKKKGSYF
jgi:hypothetical protein